MANTLSPDEIMAELSGLTAGLLYPSETDAPVRPLQLSKEASTELDGEAFLLLQGQTADTPIQTFDFDEFFARRIEERADQDDLQRQMARRIRALAEFLKSNLTDLRVYKMGRLHFDVFALGKAIDGTWVGISTEVVET